MCRCVAVSTGSWINEGITHPARAGLKRMTCTMKGMQHSVEGQYSTAYRATHGARDVWLKTVSEIDELEPCAPLFDSEDVANLVWTVVQ